MSPVCAPGRAGGSRRPSAAPRDGVPANLLVPGGYTGAPLRTGLTLCAAAMVVPFPAAFPTARAMAWLVIPGVAAPWAATAAAIAPLVPPKQSFPQILGDRPQMHEVAVATAGAGVLLVLPAGGFTEVGDRGELAIDGPPGVKAALQAGHSPGCCIFVPELGIDRADHMVGQVVTDVQILDLAMLGKLFEDILIELFEMLLALARINGHGQAVGPGRGVERGILVHVLHQQCWTDGGSVMQAGAAITMSASPNLEVEGAVHTILLCAKDGSQMLGHGEEMLKSCGLLKQDLPAGGACTCKTEPALLAALSDLLLPKCAAHCSSLLNSAEIGRAHV